MYRLESGLKGTFTALERARGNTSGVGTWEVWKRKRCMRCGFSRCALRLCIAYAERAHCPCTVEGWQIYCRLVLVELLP